jgi:hypothetical protein
MAINNKPVTFTPVKSQEVKSIDLRTEEAKNTASRQAEALAYQIQHIDDIGIGFTGKVTNTNSVNASRYTNNPDDPRLGEKEVELLRKHKSKPEYRVKFNGQKQALYDALLEDYKGGSESKITISVKDKPSLEVEVTPKNIDRLTEALKKATTAAYEFNTDVFHTTIHKERNIHAYTPAIEEKGKEGAREKFVQILNSELGGITSNLGAKQTAKAQKLP